MHTNDLQECRGSEFRSPRLMTSAASTDSSSQLLDIVLIDVSLLSGHFQFLL